MAGSEVGDFLYVKDAKHCWLLHKCMGHTDSGATMLELQAPFVGSGTLRATSTKKLTDKNSRRCDVTHRDEATNDVSNLNEVSEAAVLEVLRRRLYAGMIYTSVADILIVVNPFKTVVNGAYPDGIESTARIPAAAREEGALPHIYRTADEAYTRMLSTGKDQSAIMSGESGAGKTIQTKLIMRYLAFICQKEAAENGGSASGKGGNARGSFCVGGGRSGSSAGVAQRARARRASRLMSDVRRRSSISLLRST